ncbi:hypothetical protein ABLE93_03100 [Xanthobacter sp. KR7-65]|uniref:hypothetical protein n=1 Tax=Xanthobacter sp. KR7-65 TaxID=3156612 RepID=UPI0032B402CF
MSSSNPPLSSAERRRQLEESVATAMDRYKADFEAVRAKSSRLRAEREARDAELLRAKTAK